MLRSSLIHPEIVSILAYCGHGSRILIADGNYPLAEKTGNAKKIYLGLKRGLPTVTDVLEQLHTMINIEAASVMVPDEGPEPEIFSEFRAELGENVTLEPMGRYEFYDACMKDDAIILAISTGEQRVYANILITVGCA